RRGLRGHAVDAVEELIGACRGALTEAQPTLAVREIVARAVAEPARLQRALGPISEGGLHVLHGSAELSVLHVVWAPRMHLPPHDHRMWAVIGIHGGAEDNHFFRRRGAGIEAAGGRELREGDVFVLGADGVHSVTNPLTTSFTGAIHVYGGDFVHAARSEWDDETLEERDWDYARAQRLFTEANRAWERERLQSGPSS
ncbi:MAG TPA: hypothetical protein VFO60_03925, partial [Candidatus Dormibacteraeota bacterium]|nr:hypothetical protein [Candidatus Dormibacteraeota bacterium]